MNERREYKICKRCVMDISDQYIVFDEKGNCNHCENYIKTRKNDSYKEHVSEQQWQTLVAQIKDKGKNTK
jgi:uncharacterized paraquat-inducible protein A